MYPTLKHTLAIACAALTLPAFAQLTFYENPDFGGRAFSTDREVDNLGRQDFNDRASSVVVERGRWVVCENSDYGGRCVTLRPGRYASLTAMGLDDRVSSVRRTDGDRAAPPQPSADFRRRRDERLFEANVTSVRAVMGPPEQRCWLESEPAPRERVNAGGAILGAVIGGVLGHQVGGGTGRQVATVGGAVAGGAIGSQVGRGRSGEPTEVQRCENRPAEGRPTYWDVTYTFRGQEHHVQLAEPPGATITVNRRGEPRA